MNTKIRLVLDLMNKIKQKTVLPYQASWIGYDLYLALVNENFSPELNLVKEAYKTQLSVWALDDILDRQLKYAIRIAETEEQAMEYEEMHKLFSLCDEIYALECLGLKFNPDLKKVYEQNIKDAINKNKKIASVAAKQNAEQWNIEFWWFKEALK